MLRSPKYVVVGMAMAILVPCSLSLSLSSSSRFHGRSVGGRSQGRPNRSFSGAASLSMRKQKSSDRRTRRLQRGGEELTQDLIRENLRNAITSSPMELTGAWSQKHRGGFPSQTQKAGGRGRSRKRATLYNSLSTYHNKFFSLLTAEYQAEEQEVMGRIKASIDDPVALEVAGHALFDMFPERRGNMFADEVYRLVKAKDATSVYISDEEVEKGFSRSQYLPHNSKFSDNDVILLTLQLQGSGDFFDPDGLPTSSTATSIEARVIGTGPTYIDIAIAGGQFEAAFGPAPNNAGPSGPGDARLRLRADRFFSDVPYTRMVAALSQLTAVPERNKDQSMDSLQAAKEKEGKSNPHGNIQMDELLRETIISSHAFTDPSSPLFHDVDAFDLQHLSKLVSKPPMPSSVKLANQALAYIQNNPHGIFNQMNGPQLAAIGAALTRKLTMIQGPPGSGKTAIAAAIGFGFTHQCRSISPNAKALACAFSNVGADNLAEEFLKLGLKIVRVGKASAVSEHLWDNTLDAAVHADPEAQKAMDNAARATAQLAKLQQRRKTRGKNRSSTMLSDKTVKEIATIAVKQSIQACNKAASKALREADIIVSTSTGAADPRLLAACGLKPDMDDMVEDNGAGSRKQVGTAKGVEKAKMEKQQERIDAPDGLPPLSLPFVIVDEACQSVEPATLIPVTASNSCRSLVLLGDPCQLPATVKSDSESVLKVSLMERLAATMPAPMVNTKTDVTKMDSSYLDALPIKQARSLMRSYEGGQSHQMIYRKRFAGSLLLGIQYRMHPSIAAFSSALFYDSLLATPEFLGEQRPFPALLQNMMPCGNPQIGVRLVNVGGRCNEKRGEANKFTRTVFNQAQTTLQESTTFSNEAEAVRVVALIRKIIQDSDPLDSFSPKSIGVVTPYSGQVQLIKNMISNDREIVAMTSNSGSTIEVKSVDGYQGRERDVIIFSAVRSNQRANIGFLTDWRRLNVALTRARQALLVVGDVETLAEGDKHWAVFHKWCQGVRCIVDDTEYTDESESL